MTKTCSRCHEGKPLECFHKNRGERDGHHCWCKQCRRNHYLSPHGKMLQRRARRRYRETDRGKAMKRKSHPMHSNNWKKKNPEKVRAHKYVHDAIERGRLQRPDVCEDCGKTGGIQAHHPDYNKPKEIRWLCHACHRSAHYEAMVDAALVMVRDERRRHGLEEER